MHKKKGMAIEALMRIIIAIILLFIAIKVGQKVISIFAGSDAPKSLEDFTQELNDLKNGESKSAFVILDPDMAVIGFSKSATEFRCYGCLSDREYSGKLIYYAMKKPAYSECSDKACACVCLSDFSALPASEGEARELYCRKFYCRTLTTDIASDLSLQGPSKRSGVDLPSYPYWQNGFMFVRATSSGTPSNGMASPNSDRKQTVCIAKINRDGNFYSAALPLACASQ
ncbi:MAG: hypothetical protein AABX25_03785 [Nanoarchaeota archaeon]